MAQQKFIYLSNGKRQFLSIKDTKKNLKKKNPKKIAQDFLRHIVFEFKGPKKGKFRKFFN